MIHVPVHIKGLIFDCDGTLVDSMPTHLKVWESTFESFGVALDVEYIDSLKGMDEVEVVKQYCRKFNLDLDFSAVVKTKHLLFDEHIPTIKPLEPIVNIAKEYHGRIPLAVVSGGTRDVVHAELDNIKIKNLFDVILTADDPIPAKPAPDLFVEAALRMKVAPGLCQVFEDADTGLEGAKLAGMQAVDVRLHLK